MKRIFRRILLCAALCLLCTMTAAAAPADDDARLLAVFHADTVDLAALSAAAAQGADYIAVQAVPAADGRMVLQDSDLTVEDAARALGETKLILDVDWADRAVLRDAIERAGLTDSVLLRTTASAKQITSFLNEQPTGVQVIGVYRGNIIFNAVSHLRRLTDAGQPLVQYQSKNYFNVAYENLFPALLKKSAVRAIAAAWDPALCGRRGDDVTGWDDLIGKGYSVIETRNISGLAAYIAQCETEHAALHTLLDSAAQTDPLQFDAVGQKTFSAALQAAKDIDAAKYPPLSLLQKCRADLFAAMRLSASADAAGVQRGSLQVSVGKIAAIVIFGALIFAGQVYVFRMRKKKEA